MNYDDWKTTPPDEYEEPEPEESEDSEVEEPDPDDRLEYDEWPDYDEIEETD